MCHVKISKFVWLLWFSFVKHCTYVFFFTWRRETLAVSRRYIHTGYSPIVLGVQLTTPHSGTRFRARKILDIYGIIFLKKDMWVLLQKIFCVKNWEKPLINKKNNPFYFVSIIFCGVTLIWGAYFFFINFRYLLNCEL